MNNYVEDILGIAVNLNIGKIDYETAISKMVYWLYRRLNPTEKKKYKKQISEINLNLEELSATNKMKGDKSE